MSVIQEKLCCKILNEYFGKIVSDVAEVLMKKGINSLSYIISVSQLPRNKVRESLCVLIKHNLVTWDENRPGIPGYTLLNDRVLLLLRFPRYVFLVRETYGEEAEMVVDILSKEGQATASQVIVCSALKLLEAADEGAKSDADTKHISVRNAFERLVSLEFLQRCPNPQDPEQSIPVMTINQELLHKFNGEFLDLKLLQEEIRERRSNPDPGGGAQTFKTIRSHPDADTFWRLNYDRFHIELRDSAMRSSISCRIDPLAGACFGAILKVSYRRSDPWVATFQPVLAAEIRDQQKDAAYLEQYLKILVEDGGDCLRKIGDAGGGQYVLSVAAMVRALTLSHIDNVVRERFGSKGARIFRLVRESGMLEQDHISELSLTGKRDTNALTHRLLADGFLRLYEVRKGIAPSPASKSLYLFHVDVGMVVRMLLEWTYKSLYNLMEQREMRHAQNKRLLERKTRVEMIVENLRQSGGTEEQIQEVEDIFSPSERAMVQSVIETQDKLLDFETALDQTIFLLEMFLYYETHKT